ncbi:MAG: 4-hydroxythreonine-4-phosphate dehydrogenase PdxA [Opitutae bacterium]|nr:4-hydroxythreonine-4-phosphate dehydrogenase PdxA [Opitutae bacterium]|tara:strand:- start:3567 stop:4547 length:981 start_codon:yes stop_codon:yes gene_type:complete
MSLPRIAVTTGDPAGIGPEVCLKLLTNPTATETCQPIVFGDRAVLEKAATECGLPFHAKVFSSLDEAEGPGILDFGEISAGDYQTGRINAATGKAGYRYVTEAIDAALAGKVDAVTTGPLNKEALRMAEIPFPGHTEIFASRTKSERACMLQYSDEVRCVFVTTHVGYAEVPGLLTEARILDVIELAAETMERIRGYKPKLLCCGLNPHAGENGLFGECEEEEIIAPTLEKARDRGIDVTGPLPPDTIFLPARRKEYDCVVCMYHDQGHIPLKALAFDEAVNMTLGLPIIRTSVDHGTALDIAGQGIAKPNSLQEAVRLAGKLASE